MADEAADEDGIQVVLTPIQLAAVLQGGSIHEASTLSNRFWGAMSVVGGAVEMVASAPLWMAPEPTLATKVGAGLLTGLGADVAGAGLRQVWTGRRTITLSAEAVQRSLRSLGVDPALADRLGRGTDMAANLSALVAAPLSVARTAQALRVTSVRNGLIDLAAEETFPGAHTIARHVGKDVDWLRRRLVNEPDLLSASSFLTLEDAEIGVTEVLSVRAVEIADWAASAPVGFSRGFQAVTSVRGIVVTKSGLVTESALVRVVLRKCVLESRVFYVLTAYVVR